MSEIPEDIMKTAEEAYIEHFYAEPGNIILCIAAVIAAERERCAKIADEQWSDNGPSFGWNQCALKIATAIRNPKP